MDKVRYEPDAKGHICLRPNISDLLADIIWTVRVDAGEAAQTTRLGYSSSEPPAAVIGHRGRHYRIGDLK